MYVVLCWRYLTTSNVHGIYFYLVFVSCVGGVGTFFISSDGFFYITLVCDKCNYNGFGVLSMIDVRLFDILTDCVMVLITYFKSE